MGQEWKGGVGMTPADMKLEIKSALERSGAGNKIVPIKMLPRTAMALATVWEVAIGLSESLIGKEQALDFESGTWLNILRENLAGLKS